MVRKLLTFPLLSDARLKSFVFTQSLQYWQFLAKSSVNPMVLQANDCDIQSSKRSVLSNILLGWMLMQNWGVSQVTYYEVRENWEIPNSLEFVSHTIGKLLVWTSIMDLRIYPLTNDVWHKHVTQVVNVHTTHIGI